MKKKAFLTMGDLDNTKDRLNDLNWSKQLSIAGKVIKNMQAGRIEIAICAMHACEVLEHKRKKYKTEYTPKKFADSLGVAPKSLYQWMAIARNIVLKLPENMYEQKDYAAARRAHERLTIDAPKDKVASVFREEKAIGPNEYYLENLIKYLRAGSKFVFKNIKTLPEDRLRLLAIYARFVIRTIEGQTTLPAEDPKPKQIENRTNNLYKYKRKTTYNGEAPKRGSTRRKAI